MRRSSIIKLYKIGNLVGGLTGRVVRNATYEVVKQFSSKSPMVDKIFEDA